MKFLSTVMYGSPKRDYKRFKIFKKIIIKNILGPDIQFEEMNQPKKSMMIFDGLYLKN